MTHIKVEYRPRDLTHRCQGCGAWLTPSEARLVLAPPRDLSGGTP